jgi:transposase
MQAERCFVGADVAKAEFVIAGFGAQRMVSRPVQNNPTAIGRWLRTLPASSCIAMESTGKYHKSLADIAHARGFEVYLLNARHVHHYSKSLGRRGKTDRLDAEVIARYAALEHANLHRYEPTPAHLQSLSELQRLRAQTVQAWVSLRQSCRDCDKGTRDLIEPALAGLKAAVSAVEAEMGRRIQAQEKLAQTYALVTSVTGIGLQTGTALSILFERVAFTTSDAVVAFAGLDPRPRESGQFVGVRKLSKQGNAALRALLYNAASSAARSGVFKGYYQALRAKKFASTQALIILARKLLRIAYGVWRSGKPFDHTRLRPVTG